MSVSMVHCEGLAAPSAVTAKPWRPAVLGKFLLTVPAILQAWHEAAEMRRELALLDARQLDDIGLTPADRDCLLRR